LRRDTGPVAAFQPCDTCQTDPDLALILAAWSTLPAPVRAGMVAMVKAAQG
jgi:hypothetical protein